METVKLFRMTSDEAPLRRGGGMKYALPALPRRRLLWPVLALGGLLLGILSIGLVLADTLDNVRALKPDTAKAVRPDSTATKAEQSNFQPGTGRLTGRVTEAKTGEPMSFGTYVKIKGVKDSTFTGHSGYYTIINIPPGKYTIQAATRGYYTVTKKNVKILPDSTTVRNIKMKMEIGRLRQDQIGDRF